MNHRFSLAFHRLVSVSFLIALVFGAFSCDNSEELGFELTPPGERFAYFKDSSSFMTMTTLRQDSLTSERRDPVLLGSAHDDVFGTQTAGFLSQFRLTSSNVDFGNEIALDSAILILKYDGYYGDTLTPQHLRVYELLEDLVYDSTYYSNLDVSEYYDESNPIADLTFLPAPTTDSLAFRVSEEVALKILTADTSHLVDNTAFLEYFKGLYFKSDPVSSGGALSYFDLAGERSRLTLYYSNAEDDSLSYEVLINDNCTWVSLFEHDYSGSEAEPYINDSLYSNDLVFLQGAAGLRAGVSIEFSDSILLRAEEGIAINKAELILPIEPGFVDETRIKPTSLSIYAANEDGTNEFIEDIFLGEDYYDGSYHSDREAYAFNIARHVQNILHLDEEKRIENKGLFLVLSNSRVSGNGLVLRNGHREDGIKLSITYTLVK